MYEYLSVWMYVHCVCVCLVPAEVREMIRLYTVGVSDG